MTRHYLMLITDPALLAQLDARIAEITRITGLASYDVRQRLRRPGVSLLGALEPRAAARSAEALAGAGYRVAVLDREQLSGVRRPHRIAGVSLGGGRAELLDVGGATALVIDGSSRVLLVAADLDADPLALARSRRAAPGRSDALRALSRGYAVLRIFIEGREDSGLLISGRFNYRSLGERASVSAAQNFQVLVKALLDTAGEASLDMDFQLADVPPIRAELPLDERHPRLEAFEAHARVAHALWSRDLPVGETAPAPAGEPAPGAGVTASAAAAVRVMSDPERRRSDWRDRLRLLGPLWLYVLCGAVGAVLILLIRPEEPAVVLSCLGLCGSPLLLYFGGHALMEKREIEDFPTSRARSVAMGKVELSGRAVSAVPLRAPWSGVECVWYRWVRQEVTIDSKGNRRWKVTGRGDSRDLPFLIEDETGRVMVDPAGAVLRVSRRTVLSGSYVSFQNGSPVTMPLGSDVRVIEEALPVGCPLYVLGTARPLSRGGRDRRSELRERIRALKADPTRLMSFDADGDGRIDPEEWEVAVASLEQALIEEQLADSSGEPEPVSAVIGRGSDDSLFLISDRPEAELVRGLALRAAAGLLGGLAAAGAGTWGLLSLCLLSPARSLWSTP